MLSQNTSIFISPREVCSVTDMIFVCVLFFPSRFLKMIKAYIAGGNKCVCRLFCDGFIWNIYFPAWSGDLGSRKKNNPDDMDALVGRWNSRACESGVIARRSGGGGGSSTHLEINIQGPDPPPRRRPQLGRTGYLKGSRLSPTEKHS